MREFHNKDVLYVDSVTLMVRDLSVSLEYYQKVIGLKVFGVEGNVATLGVSKDVLLTLVENKNAKANKNYNGLYHFALLLPDRLSLGRLIKHYIKTNQKIVGASDHGVSEALYLQDPDNNGIEIYRDRDKDEWQYENDEVVMYTKQMDVMDVLKEAKDEKEFDFLPETTVLGHVHFYVKDLDLASKFFIDALGFNQMLYYGNQALFLSSKGYHHHVGLNTWNMSDKYRDSDTTGLISYNLNVPKSEKQAFIDSLSKNNIEIILDEKGNYVIDINNVKVYFK